MILGKPRLPALVPKIGKDAVHGVKAVYNVFSAFELRILGYIGCSFWLADSHIVRCRLNFAMCDLHLAMCDLHLAMCGLHFAMCDLHFAMCDLHLAMCSLHLAMCSLHFAMCDLHLQTCGLHLAICGSHFPMCKRRKADVYWASRTAGKPPSKKRRAWTRAGPTPVT
jgi:hypothetical protein